MRFYPGFLALLLASTPLLAEPSMRVDIPFAFEMSGKVLPAGSYEISFLTPVVSAVRNTADHAHRALSADIRGMHRGGKAIETRRLVFHRYGDRHFLAQIWTHEGSRLLQQSRQEREIVTSRVLAQAASRETVVVFARLAR